jgi:hypothetical protein
LDNILRALHTKRSVQSFGEIRKLKIAEEEGEQELLSQEIIDIEEETYKEWQWAFIDNIYDWLDNNGKRLTNYKPPDIEFTYFIGDISPPSIAEINRFKRKLNKQKEEIPKSITGRLKNIVNERM